MQHRLHVAGMTCGHCERAVVNAVREVDNNATVTVDRSTGQVLVDSEHERDAIAQAIQEEGYQVSA